MTYIIAEIGANHQGSMQLAKKLIDEAQACGVSAVKFQSWTPSSLYAKSYLRDNPGFHAELEKNHLSIKQLRYLAGYTEVDFICSVFSRKEADELEDVLDLYKIASMDLNNVRLLEHIASKSKPVILSCGMGTIDEIGRAVDILRKLPLTLLHCVSLYPPEYSEVNLSRMLELKKFGVNVGYSDHMEGITTSLVAAALGPIVIEKHFTIDKNAGGWDDHISADIPDMVSLVIKSEFINQALEPVATPDLDQRREMRRSIICACNLKKGHRITEEDIIFRRPGTGISCDKTGFVIGKKAKRDLYEGQMLSLEDVR